MTYNNALRECLDAHREHNDSQGVWALERLMKVPRYYQSSLVRNMDEYARDVCLNAIGYAEQESRA